MIITRTPIRSCARQDAPAPWYALSATAAGRITIGAANQGGAASPLADTTRTLGATFAAARVQAAGVAPDALAALAAAVTPADTAAPVVAAAIKAMTPLAIAVTLDGQLEIVPLDEQRSEYLAHLGFYNPVTDTLELLEFLEMHTDAEHDALDAEPAP